MSRLTAVALLAAACVLTAWTVRLGRSADHE
jgi:hypothetical protein